jgi:hypothetical protein
MDARYCEVMRAALIKDIRPEGRRYDHPEKFVSRGSPPLMISES